MAMQETSVGGAQRNEILPAYVCRCVVGPDRPHSRQVVRGEEENLYRNERTALSSHSFVSLRRRPIKDGLVPGLILRKKNSVNETNEDRLTELLILKASITTLRS